jgi:hypothetical protein
MVDRCKICEEREKRELKRKGALSWIMYLLVGLGLLIGLATYLPIFGLGYTTLSLSEAQFSSSNQFFNDKVWILTVAQQGMGQYAYGKITSDEIGSKSGTKPEKNFTIDISYSKQACEYDIKRMQSATPIYEFRLAEWSVDFLTGCRESDAFKYCPNAYFYGQYNKVYLGFTRDCFCIDRVPVTGAVAPYIENPNVRTRSTITVSNGVEFSKLDVDTKGQISGFIGNNVYVIWNGNLMKASCASQSPYYAFYQNGEWKIGFRDRYEAYLASLNSKMSLSQLYACNLDRNCISLLVDEVNRASSLAQSTAIFGNLVNKTKLDGAVIEVNLEDFVQVPVYTFYVKASWLGIYQPVPDPQIVSAFSNKFKSGDYGEIVVTIRNDGDSGNIEVWAECESPFRPVETTKTLTIPKNQEFTTSIKITASSSQPVSKSCIVYAKALNKIVSRSVAVSVDPLIYCEPNKQRCVGNERRLCNQYGSGETIIETCKTDEVCVYEKDGTTKCQAMTTTIPQSQGDNNLWKTVAIILAIIVLLFLFSRWFK